MMHHALFLLLASSCEPAPVPAQGAGPVVASEGAPVPGGGGAADTSHAAARRALADGRPWAATQLLAPVVRQPARRTPEAVLLAGEAAAGWNGWTEVDRLLAGERWLDTLFAGRGRELLARSALARSPRAPRTDTLALAHARCALAAAEGVGERGTRLVLLARAHDRLDQLDSARAHYLAAAALLPEAREWLALRAAGVTADSAARQALYAGVRSPAAAVRIAYTEAAARERAGDLPAAAAAYAGLGQSAAALRLRLLHLPDSAARLAIRDELVALVGRRAGAWEARLAVELLDRHYAPLTPAEELAVARSAAATGPAERAVRGFVRARAAGLGGDEDAMAHGAALSRLRRDREAVKEFARVRPPSRLAGAAAYQRARSLLRAGDGMAARAALRDVVRRFPNDPAGAGAALFLLGDLATDEDGGGDAEARKRFAEMGRRFPTSSLAGAARLRAAIIAFAAGSVRVAAAELDALAAAAPDGPEALAARYWAGRAWAAAGDSARARERWLAAAAREPLSYYAMLAERRLGRAAWAPASGPDSLPRLADVDSAARRAALLEAVGMDDEARFEYERLEADAGSSVERLLATAAAFRERGRASPGIRLARRALARGAPASAAVYRLVYPVVLESVLRAESVARDIDPALVAALVRQESNFTPGATSPAGARGLMQMMPEVGRRVAAGLDFPFWDPVLLYQPDVNARLGTTHLAGVLGQYPHPVYALAAYNAGSARVERWREKPGTDDPELFAERIPYVETRDYVRIILRSREMYGALYEKSEGRD